MMMLMTDSIIFIIQGTAITLEYTFIALFGGVVIGAMLALLKFNQIGTPFINAYISVLRGTPLLVQLTITYFVIPSVLNIPVSIFAAGCIAFTLNSSAYIAEIIRAGLNSIDKGQFEACHALHIPTFYMYKDIILPQVFKTILPALINEAIALLKETALISILGEQDIMRRAQLVGAEHYNYIQPLITAGICYYVLTFILEWAAKKVEKVKYDYQRA